MPVPDAEIDDDVAGPDDLAQRALVSRHAMTVAQVEAVLVDYPGHEEVTEVRRSGAKPAACAPPWTTAPPHSTHACALSPGTSRRTPTTRCAGILESERSMTSARLSSRQVAEKGARRAIAVTEVLRSRIVPIGRRSLMLSTGRRLSTGRGSLTVLTGRGSRGSLTVSTRRGSRRSRTASTGPGVRASPKVKTLSGTKPNRRDPRDPRPVVDPRNPRPVNNPRDPRPVIDPRNPRPVNNPRDPRPVD